MWARLWLVALAAGGRALAVDDRPWWEDGSDLENFVSRPDIKAPRLMVAKHQPDRITDGYWFVTPYSHFDGEPRTARREFKPCQTGAHIYDADGNLIWSGACWGGNRNIFGFKPITVDGQHYLTMYLPGRTQGQYIPAEERNGSGIILNNRYEEVSRTGLHGYTHLDFHEFNVQPGGNTAIVTTTRNIERAVPELNQTKRRLVNVGFQEVEIHSGSPTFNWDPLEHGVLLNESCNVAGKSKIDYWDYLHINSVDKNQDGDYFVSGRHTSTIYKVSGKDGHVIWRLGGYASDFVMEDGLQFFWQHDIRFRFQNETTTIISLFDNTGEDEQRNPDITPSVSSGKIIVLDTASTPMTARMLRRIDRPDGNWSSRLGNVHILGDDIEKDNVLVNWAIQGYVSEHDAHGNCVLEARFQSERMSSYRAYKANFIGTPAELPTLKILPVTIAKDTMSTGFYVSWNGATEVASWDFYGGMDESGPFRKLGSARRTGFETSWVEAELVQYAYAEAIDKVGTVLGRSTLQNIRPPTDGHYKAASNIPIAADAQYHAPSRVKVLPSTDTAMSKASGWVSALVFDSFALWGFYCITRKVVTKDFRW